MSSGKKSNHTAGDTEQNTQLAATDLRDCVRAMRWSGRGTAAALEQVAEAYGVSTRWLTRLFYLSDYVAMPAARRRHLALRAADFIETVADDLDRRAVFLRAMAAEKRTREQQLKLPMAELGEWAVGEVASQGPAK